MAKMTAQNFLDIQHYSRENKSCEGKHLSLVTFVTVWNSIWKPFWLSFFMFIEVAHSLLMLNNYDG